jgi:aryl-alcohol dehydrogenase-like predicted oxidoreductase
MTDRNAAGVFPLGDQTVGRLGYGAMQLAGPGVFGPPKDHGAALAVLREAVANGVDHIDTSDFYGPHVTNRLIREALHPYPKNLVIVTKVGAVRGDDASWIPALMAADLTTICETSRSMCSMSSTCVWAAFTVRAPDRSKSSLQRLPNSSGRALSVTSA